MVWRGHKKGINCSRKIMQCNKNKQTKKKKKKKPKKLCYYMYSKMTKSSAFCYMSQVILTLQPYKTFFAKSIDPDEMAHNQDLHCLPFCFDF